MSTPSSSPDTKAEAEPLSTQRILRAFTGSLIAGTIAILFAKMLSAIATSFANKPVTSDNITVINLSAAVRTLVLGIVALGTGVFGMAAVGLLLLGAKMAWQRLQGADTLDEASNAQD
ncbi:DUF3082 domain-containing protein [Oscillatoria sp. CS-180]|uniref:DUF3082 domain-containing protein n=1 Tax=Oscillatoria sp. CS-180 TaxID=3021720 RepID=UPI00232B4EDD|nr:DUF3082 domain-containing protein [Oscillatoria sp. CS-180]MDB9526641.1 DUF3082 domain-containing protein [Oscillatoria sp. CS-180]